jgi:hypothetical protein
VSAESVSHLFQVVLVVCALGRTRGRRFRSYLEDLRMNGVSIAGVVATQPAPRKGIRQLAGGTGSAARGDEVAADRAVPTADDGLTALASTADPDGARRRSSGPPEVGRDRTHRAAGPADPRCCP